MASLMLVVSVSFKADVHYCKGEVKSISIFGKASSCHKAAISCPHHKEMLSDTQTEDCCSNKTFDKEDLDLDYNVSVISDFSDIQFEFFTSFVSVFLMRLNHPEVKASTFPDHIVQLSQRDTYALLNRYLI